MQAVFFHAFGADRLSWAGTTPALSGVTSVAGDLPGHGKRIDDLGDGSLADLADRSAMGPDEGKAWYVGHSLGGSIALELAAREPERCAGLVLMCPLGLGTLSGLDPVVAYPQIQSVEDMDIALKAMVEKKAVISDQFAAYGFGHLNRPGAREALTRIADQLPRIAEDTRKAIEVVVDHQIETTVIWGTKDSVTQPDTATIPKAWDLHTLADVGHVPHIEALKDVNALLRTKLTS